MSRDHRKLRVFQLADALALRVYSETAALPMEERFALQAQLRRAAVSVAANIVEGSARRSTPEYCRFLEIALASASEAAYLLSLARRLGYLAEASSTPIEASYGRAQGMLHRMVGALTAGPKP